MQIIRTKIRGVITYQTVGLDEELIATVNREHQLEFVGTNARTADNTTMCHMGKMLAKAKRRDGVKGVHLSEG